MSVARTVKIDWAKIVSTLGLTGSTVSALSGFRKRHDEAVKAVVELGTQPTSVDFAFYRKTLKNQEIVDKIENAYKSFTPVTYDVSKQLKTIEAFEAKALANAKETSATIEKELQDLEATLSNIETARPFDQLTLDDLRKARPDIDAKVTEAVTKGRWETPGYDEKFGSAAAM
ncbi:uncharacterized protein SAPINGB_P000787 [Magnusiomyces paraingens]|uniref:ATP synthase subunit d, mitochondrial n=1 Tax=Magnusiomyces paraingens TaxID=2606893 RepID=A0A5E8B2V8_9ASCO|nr:uncharacterized protein SAPINGB_P000787 [Saprochaete ingens]VVT45549.1 unnamed protein product [Saprochaete ingens]